VDGVVVIPRHLAEEVASDSAEQEKMEDFIIQKIAGGAPLRGTYPPNAETKEAYMAWKRREL
jgi:regulator of RNase E activity RraA